MTIMNLTDTDLDTANAALRDAQARRDDLASAALTGDESDIGYLVVAPLRLLRQTTVDLLGDGALAVLADALRAPHIDYPPPLDLGLIGARLALDVYGVELRQALGVAGQEMLLPVGAAASALIDAARLDVRGLRELITRGLLDRTGRVLARHWLRREVVHELSIRSFPPHQPATAEPLELLAQLDVQDDSSEVA